MMKKVFCLLWCVILFSSCGKAKEETSSVSLSVSLAPQKHFLQMIVGDFAEVHVLVPSGTNPEVYDPSPAEIAKLEDSRAYFAIGTLPFETEWVKALPEDVEVIDQAKLLPQDLIFSHDGKHAHVHIHGDPHYWTSVTGARAMAEVMLKELIRLFPDEEELFRENYKHLEGEINDIEKLAKATFEDKDEVAFVIYHPSLSLFADEWNLHQLVIEENGLEPTARHLVRLMDEAKRLDTKVVLIQEEFDTKNAESIGTALELPLRTIHPLAENWKEEMKQLICSFE
ncbi:zinc ABC transporter substrate-binding protein [Porphyromonadaceae bacterium W3.11]|nr:zinc ABC transporter substrate-binding protein [Porphyromonadaceae bacterium W3.11]